ncbi:hypothetical protein Tco_0770841 [Tanacetum coccineum]|uniref:Uncharacterized protein n=1 Tax=Tanacetum coccineum TaxID=301880 RepID=A0ABQ4ZEC5_9ASTR
MVGVATMFDKVSVYEVEVGFCWCACCYGPEDVLWLADFGVRDTAIGGGRGDDGDVGCEVWRWEMIVVVGCSMVMVCEGDSVGPTKVEVPKALPKVSMVNTSLKKLKHHLAGFDVVVKERTTSTSITKGLWGFEHTKACFRDEIIVKALKDLFNTFDQYLIDELSEVQNVFHQMEQAVEQHHLE